MAHDTMPMTFAEAIDWIGRRGGHYAMKINEGGILISVRVGDRRASVVASSTNERDLQAALIDAIGKLPADPSSAT